MATKYRKISPRIWSDEKFCACSDDAQLAFLFTLTHPHMTSVGAMRATVPGLAKEKGWTLTKGLKAFSELFQRRLLEYDAVACAIVAPKFVRYNPPENPNVVKAWAQAFEELPECGLIRDHAARVKEFLKGFPKPFQEAFGEPFAKGLANQEQEQEQEQEQLKKPFPEGRGALGNPSSKPALHQPLVDRFLDLKGTPRAQLSAAQVTGAYRRHSRAALALITEAGGLDHALAALEIGARYFDAKGLTWTLDTIARHLPNIARWSQTHRGDAAGLTAAQVSYAEQLAAWLGRQPGSSGGVAAGAESRPAQHEPRAGGGVALSARPHGSGVA